MSLRLVMHLILAAILLSAALTVAWAVRMRTGQSGWIDAIWSFSVGVGGIFLALAPWQPPFSERQWLCAGLVAFWSLRLGIHIVRRAATSEHDDPRYAELARQWGAKFKARLLWFLQIQALCAFGLSVSVWAAAHAPRPNLDWQDWLGVAILVLSVIGEGIADAQLRAFGREKANKGNVCDVGLWAWSRHPNYFFEWLGWIAYVAIAIAPGYGQGWLALIAPVLMYWLLVHVSGVPFLEQHMLRSRGDAFRDYQRRVSQFWLLPPATKGK